MFIAGSPMPGFERASVRQIVGANVVAVIEADGRKPWPESDFTCARAEQIDLANTFCYRPESLNEVWRRAAVSLREAALPALEVCLAADFEAPAGTRLGDIVDSLAQGVARAEDAAKAGISKEARLSAALARRAA